MRKRHYDDYDYEEAYQKQIENLEEWELERLMKDGKVECLYRTTTTKSTNIKSGTTLLEAQVYPSFKDKGWRCQNHHRRFYGGVIGRGGQAEKAAWQQGFII